MWSIDRRSWIECAHEPSDFTFGDDGEYTGVGGLVPSEIPWRERYSYLEKHGYVLRPRYKPKWKPSWIGKNINLIFFEDSIFAGDNVLDATQASTGGRVSMKVVKTESADLSMARMLSSPELLRDPANHCVPIIDIIPDPQDSAQSLLVMPYLRPCYDPAFEAIGEVVDFVRQTLEGLAFFHSQGVAHRDCILSNIMMDARPLYPNDHHPVTLSASPDKSKIAQHRSRIDHPVKYYYTSFGQSSHFKEGEPPYGPPKYKAPELSHSSPYNDVMFDVGLLGDTYRTQFLQKYTGLEFLEPLVSAMTQAQQEKRPTAESALEMFRDIHADLSDLQLRWRLRDRDESVPKRVAYDAWAVAKEGVHQLNQLLAI